MNDIVHVAVAVIANDNDEICISLRHEDAHQGGLWEFPGGKIEQDESVEQALRREIKEELDLNIESSRPLITIKHDYDDKSVCLHVRKITRFKGQATGAEGQEVKWVPASSLSEYDFPAANVPVIRSVTLPDSYLITGTFTNLDDFSSKLEKSLEAGIRLVQLRIKPDLLERSMIYPDIETPDLIRCASDLCVSHHARLMLNLPEEYMRVHGSTGEQTDPETNDMTFDGFHLDSKTLMTTTDVEPYRKRGRLLSASCHTADELFRAQQLGLDFVVLSPVNETTSHPGAAVLGWDKFEDLVRNITIPVYALGGLNGDDIEQSWHRGAQGIAGISCFWPTIE